MKNLLFIALLASFIYGTQAIPPHTMQHHQEMLGTQSPLSLSEQMRNLMHEPMMKEPFLESDNLDLNFITNMIPHHQGAILSSEFILKHSKNKQMRTIAQNIIKAQKAEIEAFNALIPILKEQKRLYSPKEVTLFNNQAKADMELMSQQMSALALTKRLERDFIQSMIPHHEAAIKSAKQILIYTQNEQIKAIAQQIIQVQEQEIETFATLLQKLR